MNVFYNSKLYLCFDEYRINDTEVVIKTKLFSENIHKSMFDVWIQNIYRILGRYSFVYSSYCFQYYFMVYLILQTKYRNMYCNKKFKFSLQNLIV